ncbi:MAG: helix-turn-helix transcriptional regulator [Treponema sp.]|nr:helix-turn-helix transcriptional regulator [Treponema sp.]
MSLRGIFTENLKFYRKNAGLSQQQLAEKADIATNYLSEIERGLKFPSVELIERLAEELDIPPSFLFIGDKADGKEELLIKKRNSEFCKKLLSTVSDLLKEYGFLSN